MELGQDVLTLVPVRTGEVADLGSGNGRHQTSFEQLASLGNSSDPATDPTYLRSLASDKAANSMPSLTDQFTERLDTNMGVIWKCTVCGLTVRTLSGLKRHIRQRHMDSPAYRCQICGMGFMSRPHYVGHMGAHSGVKNYQCSHCSKRYFYISDLTRHKRTCKQALGLLE